MPRILAGLLLTALTIPASAQETNLSLYQDMAIECLGTLPGSSRIVRLDAPDEMPYLRSALVNEWQSDDRAVYLTDAPASALTIRYVVESASVDYDRRSRNLDRSVALGLRYVVTDSTGRIEADDRCRLQRRDVVRADALESIEDASFDETRADRPEGGWVRRVLEPAVLAAATGVAVYLFFALRSSGDG